MISNTIEHTLTGLAAELGVPGTVAAYTSDILLFAALLLLALLTRSLTNHMGIFIVRLFVEKSPTRLDYILKKNMFFSRIASVAAAVITYKLAPLIIPGLPLFTAFLVALAKIYAIIIFTLASFSLMDSLHSIYLETRFSAKFALKGSLQALKLFISIVGVLLVLSVITDRTPLYFLSGLGALTAVLLLVFKDTIMGLVAGIQLSVNEMVCEGDWIEMPQFGADGEVMDFSLTTVKVRNWDKTITTIPAYALISQSFKNWRGMEESGGRRIKRSIIIDMNSIRFCDDALLSRLSKIHLVSGYIVERNREIDAYNREKGISKDSLVNGRHMTNLGVFRKYIEEYLHNNPKIHTDMTFLVRQLQPTDKGIPLEIYVFSKDQRWAYYEAIQADIFDHLLSAISEFDLKVFQSPTGADLAKLGKLS